MFPTQLIVTLSVMAISMVSAALYTADPTHQKHMWETYKTEYNKQYKTVEEEETKFKVFLDNLKIADQRTEAERKNGGTAIHGINKFSDMSKEEFKRTYLNLKVPETKEKINRVTIDRKVDTTSGLVDWTGVYTTPVKDQGYCGGCWAFAAAEQMESDTIRLSQAYYVLSPEQLIECDYTSTGCNGGLQTRAYDYVKSVGGIEKDTDYPYTSYYGTSFICKANAAKFAVKLDSWAQIDGSDTSAIESAMASYVQSTGPLSICVDAENWSDYVSGIVTVCGTDVDHAVQAVGVDTSSSGGYWKVRNQWGTSWGESGFIQLAYGQNTCDLTYQSTYTASYPK